MVSFQPRFPEADQRAEHRSRACDRHRGIDQISSPVRRFGVAICLAVAGLLSVASAAVAAPGWNTLPEDTGKLGFNTSREATADPTGIPQSESFGFKPVVQYGLTDRLTMGFGSETRLVKSGLNSNRGTQTDGFMTTEMFLRGRLPDQDWYMFSVQDLVSLPGEETSDGSGGSTLRFQYGRAGNFAGGTWSSTVQTGFQPSFDEVPEKFQADLALGWRPTNKWQLTAQSLNTVGDDGQGSLGQLSISRNLTRALSVQVGGWQTVSGSEGEPHGYDAMLWLRY